MGLDQFILWEPAFSSICPVRSELVLAVSTHGQSYACDDRRLLELFLDLLGLVCSKSSEIFPDPATTADPFPVALLFSAVALAV